uniref:Uncharacterized protein n=1 Tax=Arion vulgaris TaxID=1028688 RepID=A0A0B7BWF9_9EUPU
MQSDTIIIESEKDEKANDDEKKPEPDTIHEEFQIAADLTLYANPLRCLAKKSPSRHIPETDERQKNEEQDEKREIIAADLTKYGSPFDDKN